MATLQLNRAELARLLEAEPQGRLSLVELSAGQLILGVKLSRFMPQVSVTITLLECRDGRLRLQLAPATVFSLLGGKLEEFGLRPLGGGQFDVDSASLLGSWLPGARLEGLELQPDGVRADLILGRMPNQSPES